jgi:hypothetical protein
MNKIFWITLTSSIVVALISAYLFAFTKEHLVAILLLFPFAVLTYFTAELYMYD